MFLGLQQSQPTSKYHTLPIYTFARTVLALKSSFPTLALSLFMHAENFFPFFWSPKMLCFYALYICQFLFALVENNYLKMHSGSSLRILSPLGDLLIIRKWPKMSSMLPFQVVHLQEICPFIKIPISLGWAPNSQAGDLRQFFFFFTITGYPVGWHINCVFDLVYLGVLPIDAKIRGWGWLSHIKRRSVSQGLLWML